MCYLKLFAFPEVERCFHDLCLVRPFFMLFPIINTPELDYYTSIDAYFHQFYFSLASPPNVGAIYYVT